MKEKSVVTKLPAGEIVEIKKLADGTFEVTQKVVVEEKATSEKSNSIPKITIPEINFVQIEAESLPLEDKFMDYLPKTKKEGRTKKLIAEAIKSRVKNFYRPIMDPYFTADGIGYIAGKMPDVCKSYNWWFDAAKKYDPSRKSRLGTELQYGAFLGVLIKKLVEEGKSVEWAWNAVCNDSKELGHYWNSEDAKYELEPTGSRCICGFYDLANTSKILAEDEEAGGFWLAGGCYGSFSSYRPLAELNHYFERTIDLPISVGWLVLS
jgi:hypothetical protein